MLIANITAEIEQKYKELEQVTKDIQRMSNLITGLNRQLEILESNKRDILYKIEDLEEVLEND